MSEAATVATDSGCVRNTCEYIFAELLEITGVFARARDETAAVVERLRRDNPQVPDELWTSFEARVADRAMLAALYIPIYERHLTGGDARHLVEFYRTPLGAYFPASSTENSRTSACRCAGWASSIAVDLLGSSHRLSWSARAHYRRGSTGWHGDQPRHRHR